MDKSILDMVHESAKDLHAAGVMKETTLREFDALTFQDTVPKEGDEIDERDTTTSSSVKAPSKDGRGTRKHRGL